MGKDPTGEQTDFRVILSLEWTNILQWCLLHCKIVLNINCQLDNACEFDRQILIPGNFAMNTKDLHCECHNIKV